MDKRRLDRAEIDHVAELACLSLTDDEATKLTSEIASILAYVDELATLDISNVPPTAHVQLERAAWREDKEEPGLSHEDALAGAPRAEHGGFAVPLFDGTSAATVGSADVLSARRPTPQRGPH